MDQQRWRQIEQIYHSALEHPPSKRGAFVAGECKDDEELRHEVESLLGRDAAPAEELIDRPAWEGAGSVLITKAETQLTPGTQLGPYRVEQLIGSGGMGRVYRARDIRLGRAVAIKVSSEEFTGRFEREARAIAALAHPRLPHPVRVGIGRDLSGAPGCEPGFRRDGKDEPASRRRLWRGGFFDFRPE